MQNRRRSFRFANAARNATVGEIKGTLKDIKKEPHKKFRKAIIAAIGLILTALSNKIWIGLVLLFAIHPALAIAVALVSSLVIAATTIYIFKETVVKEANIQKISRELDISIDRDINRHENRNNLKKALISLNPESKQCREAVKNIQKELDRLYTARSESMGVDIKAIEGLSPTAIQRQVENVEDFLEDLVKYFHENPELQQQLTGAEITEMKDLAARLAQNNGDVSVKKDAQPFEGVPAILSLSKKISSLSHKLESGHIDLTQTSVRELLDIARAGINIVIVCNAATSSQIHLVMNDGESIISPKQMQDGQRLLSILSPDFKGSRYKAYCQLFFGKKYASEEQQQVLIRTINTATNGLLFQSIPSTTTSIDALLDPNGDFINDFCIPHGSIGLNETIYMAQQMSSAFHQVSPQLATQAPRQAVSSESLSRSRSQQSALDEGIAPSPTPEQNQSRGNIYEDDNDTPPTLSF